MKPVNINFQEIQKQKRYRKTLIKTSVYLIIFGAIIFGTIRLVFYSSFLRFDEIVINNIPEDKKDVLLAFLKTKIETGPFLIRTLGTNNFLSWPSNLSGKDLESMPSVESLEIKKNYSDNSLVINVVEREPFAIWCLKKNLPERCFWFDEKGIVFRQAPVTSGNIIKIISDYTQDNLAVNTKILPEEFLPNFLSILNVLSLSGLNSRDIAIKDLALQEVEVSLSQGPEIYFSLRHDSKNYLKAIQSLANHLKLSNLKYIDLRTENRIYYR